MSNRQHKIGGRGLAAHLGVVVERHQAAHRATASRVMEAIDARRAATQPEPEAADDGPVPEG